jgi:hypothetical protein
MTAQDCPACGGRGKVVKTKGATRYRRCTACSSKWKTVEKLAPTGQPAREADLAKRRGCHVPPDKEADWKTLKSSGYSNFEAAKALGLPFKLPTKGAKPVKNSGVDA